MHHGNEQRRHHRAEIRAAVENARGQRAFALGKPLGDGFDGSGKIARFADGKRAADDNMHHQHRPTKALAMPQTDQKMSESAKPSLVPIRSMSQPGQDVMPPHKRR